MGLVDVVVVSYNSGPWLRGALVGLVGAPGLSIVVVDNASTDDSLATIADLDVTTVSQTENGGFARGCNVGWRLGNAPNVLLLNPDARMERDGLERLVRVLEEEPDAAAVGPRIVHPDGSLEFSQRRFPRLRSTYAQALFLHRIFRTAAWADQVIRDHGAYDAPAAPPWISGACMLIRRSALEQVGGLDEGFFMYGEDVDLCLRLRARGYQIRYDPAAICVHAGGASAPRPSLLPVLATSRMHYARKHEPAVSAALSRAGIALGALTHSFVSHQGLPGRMGHARALHRIITGPSIHT